MGAANHVEVKQNKGKDASATVVPAPRNLTPKVAEKREHGKVWAVHIFFGSPFLLTLHN